MWERYRSQPAFVLGFHGCDKAVADRVVSGSEELRPSEKAHDWLGHGAYFWEASPARALEWAANMAKLPSSSPRRIVTPAVLGAVIDLGYCCNLFDSDALDEVKAASMTMRAVYRAERRTLPVNKGGPEKLGRFRDCAVIEFMHTLRATGGAKPYDTVRAAFPEGGALYRGAGFTRRSHIQIAVRSEACIKGYFLPRSY